jgi:hypothetical protein
MLETQSICCMRGGARRVRGVQTIQLNFVGRNGPCFTPVYCCFSVQLAVAVVVGILLLACAGGENVLEVAAQAKQQSTQSLEAPSVWWWYTQAVCLRMTQVVTRRKRGLKSEPVRSIWFRVIPPFQPP